VIVVGGGVVGCAVAWFLAREGVSVTLLERGEIAGEASGAAAGMLAPLIEADPETASGRCFLRWGRRSLGLFPRLVEELCESAGVDPEYRTSGLLRVARDAAEAAALERHAARLAGIGALDERDDPDGLELAWLGPEEARAFEPQLAPGLAGALHSPREAHVRSPLLVRAYAQAAARRGALIESGAPVMGLVRERARVVGVESAEGRRSAGQVVLCAGSWTPGFAAGLGAPLPVTPVRGQIVSLDAPDSPFSSIVWGGSTYLVPKLDGSVAVGATEEHVGFDCRVTAAGVRGLLDEAARLVPALADASFRSAWAGLRPETPDHLPLVGPVPTLDGLLVAAGHFRNGVLLSPATGEIVRDGVLGKGWAEPAFLPERWLRPAPSAG
jgi:glycine oxidase